MYLSKVAMRLLLYSLTNECLVMVIRLNCSTINYHTGSNGVSDFKSAECVVGG